MADVINSLFGVTPQALMQQRNMAADKEAMQYAQLDPFQAANYSIYKGAHGLARGFGGMMGAQDPELQRISARQQAMQGANPTDVNSMKQAVEALRNAGDYQGAMALVKHIQGLEDQAMEMKVKEAQAAKYGREGAAVKHTESMRKAMEWAQVNGYTPGTPEFNDAVAKKFNEFTGPAPAKAADFGDDREATAHEMFAKPFAQLTQEQAKAVNAAVNKMKDGRTPRITVSPEFKIPANVQGLQGDYEKSTATYRTTFEQATDAQKLINIAGQTGNTSAWESARTLVTKAIGNDKLSNADIERMGVDAAIAGKVRDFLSKTVSGVPDSETRKALYMVASYVRNQNAGRMTQIMEARKAGALALDPNLKQLDLMFPDYTKSGATAPTSGGVVEWGDMGKTNNGRK